jgi:hypothetical protein
MDSKAKLSLRRKTRKIVSNEKSAENSKAPKKKETKSPQRVSTTPFEI